MSRYDRQLAAAARHHGDACDCCDHSARPAPPVEHVAPDPHGRWADFIPAGPRDSLESDDPAEIAAARKRHSAAYARAVRLYGQADVDRFGI